MPLIARQRSRLAVLAVLALVGSLLAVSAVPVAADDGKPDHKAMYSACVGAATEDAGFTDMGGSFAADAANCLAHYGITQGTTATTYTPSKPVTRTQMALFLARAAGPAGIDLGDPEDQGLTDLDGTSEEARNAINQVVGAKIMDARNGGFAGDTHVTREDMAVHLDTFLSKGFVAGNAQGDLGKYSDIEGHKDLDTILTDLGTVTYSAYGAIQRIYDLGVTTGNTTTTYNPDGLVSRAQMAAFITRALAHTNARPAGLTVQAELTGDTGADDHNLMVSVRNAQHQPVPDAAIDVFSSTTPDDAFDDDGKCTNTVSGDCTIDSADLATDPDGNADVDDLELPATAGTLTVWVWTGDSGNKYDNDETKAVVLDIEASLPGSDTTLSDNLKKHATAVKFGDTITYTVQVVNSDDDPVGKSGLAVVVTAEIEDTSDGDGDGNKRPDTRTIRNSYKTDDDGRIEFSFTETDPDADDDSADEITLSLTWTLPDTDSVPVDTDRGQDLHIKATDLDDGTNGIQIIWTDADPKPTSLHIDQAMRYHVTNDSGVRNTVTATLVDQYGDPVAGKKIAFWSSVTNPESGPSLGLGGTDGTTPADRRTTNSRGVATKWYTRSATDAETETINAVYVVDDISADAASHYWVTRGLSETVSGTVTVADKDDNAIVIGGAKLVTYKAGDQFRIEGSPVTMDAFEKELSDEPADSVSAVIGDDEEDINSFDITTKGT